MTKISKKSAYPIKIPLVKDYFVGTDSANALKTVNFEFKDVAALINELNGTPTINYQFKTDYNIELSVLTSGVFLTETNETTVNSITKLYINKKNYNETNLIALYSFIKNYSADFYLKLQHSENPHAFVYYNITSVDSFQDHFVFNVSIGKSNTYLTELSAFHFYFFNFELKAGSGGGSADQDNKFRYIKQDLFIGGRFIDTSTPAMVEALILEKINGFLAVTNLTVSDTELIVFVFNITVMSSVIVDVNDPNPTTLFSTHRRSYRFPHLKGKGAYNPISASFSASDLEIDYIEQTSVSATPEDIQGDVGNVIFDLGDITGQDYLAHINDSATPFDLSDNTKLYYFKFIDAGVTYMYHFDEANSVNSYGIYGLGLLQFVLAELILFYNSSTPVVIIPAIDESNLVHKSGIETITGKKIFQNEGTDEAVYINNTSTGFGQYIVNIINGIGSFLNNNGAGIGQLIQNISNGTGMSIANTANGVGAYLNNAANGIGSFISNNGSGKALVINNEDSATGNPLSIQKNGVDKLTVNDAGEVTATKFIKQGGTSDQYLMADGSLGASGATPLATTTISGTVKTDVTEADPIVYTKTSADTALALKVDKVTGKSLLSDTEIARLLTLANYTAPPVSATITTALSITNATLTDAGQTQEGKVNLIANGVNAINNTINGAITASFIKGGTGAITFVQGSGRTLTNMNGTLILNGIVGSTASIVSSGTTDYLYINNL